MLVSSGKVHARNVESVAVVGEDRVSELAFRALWLSPFPKQLALNKRIAGISRRQVLTSSGGVFFDLTQIIASMPFALGV